MLSLNPPQAGTTLATGRTRSFPKCPLCHCEISLDGESWTCRAQPRNLVRGWNMPVASFAHRRTGVLTLHVACWKLVENSFGPLYKPDDSEWVHRLDSTTNNLAPWLKQIDHRFAPELADPYKFDDDPFVNSREKGCLERFHLPTEIVQTIYSYLTDWKDVNSLLRASLVSPSPRQLLSLGREYLAPKDSPLQGPTESETLDRLRWLLWNMGSRPGSFPHTQNYKAIWENLQLIRAKVAQPLHGSDLDPPMPIHRVMRAAGSDLNPKRRFLNVADVSEVCFHFSHVAGQQYLCGLAFDGDTVGYTAESSITVQVVKYFRGLMLASDGTGFTAAMVRDGDAWQSTWAGSLPKKEAPENRLLPIYPKTYSQLDWPADHAVGVSLGLDAFRIQCLKWMFSSPQLSLYQPFVWISKPPPPRLTPVLMYDTYLPVDGCKFRFVEGGELQRATGITAYFERWCLTRRLDFTLNGNVLGSIGKSDWTGCTRASFHLSQSRGEVITGMAGALTARDRSLHIGFLTSCGRAILFGPREVSWEPVWCQSGIFGSKARGLARATRLSTVGVFKDKTKPEPEPPKLSAYDCIYPVHGAVLTDEKGDRCQVLVSKVDFSSATKAMVYSKTEGKEVYITGLKVFHGDDDYMTTILGEVDDETRTVDLRDGVRAIAVFYKIDGQRRHRIQGLRFELGGQRYIGAGWLKGSVTDNIQLSQSTPVLYWAFTGSFSYLSADSSFGTINYGDK